MGFEGKKIKIAYIREELRKMVGVCVSDTDAGVTITRPYKHTHRNELIPRSAIRSVSFVDEKKPFPKPETAKAVPVESTSPSSSIHDDDFDDICDDGYGDEGFIDPDEDF